MPHSFDSHPTAAHPMFTISRTFAATRDAVWQAWSDAAILPQWWGPAGCTLTVEKLTFYANGTFLYGMQWPAAPKLYGKFVYRDITEPEQMVYVSSFSNEAAEVTRAPFSPTWPLETLSTLTLSEEDGQTLLTLRASPINATDDEMQTFEMGFNSMTQGFGATFDQLDAYLAKQKQNATV